MLPFYDDGWVKQYQGNALDILAQLPTEYIQCCVTSPPYWGLRKYAGEQELVWGGKSDCQHEWLDTSYVRNNDKTAGVKQNTNLGSVDRDEPIPNGTCSLCGAWRGQLGLEPHPDCGRPFMKLRNDLSGKERDYVLSELKAYGVI